MVLAVLVVLVVADSVKLDADVVRRPMAGQTMAGREDLAEERRSSAAPTLAYAYRSDDGKTRSTRG